MTTEIKLSGERLQNWLQRKGVKNYVDKIEIVIAELIDEADIYPTPFGSLGFKFGSALQGGVERNFKSPAALLDCEKIKILQSATKHRFHRMVNLNYRGYGRQQLDRGVDLIITTNDNLEKYQGEGVQ